MTNCFTVRIFKGWSKTEGGIAVLILSNLKKCPLCSKNSFQHWMQSDTNMNSKLALTESIWLNLLMHPSIVRPFLYWTQWDIKNMRFTRIQIVLKGTKRQCGIQDLKVKIHVLFQRSQSPLMSFLKNWTMTKISVIDI